MCDFDHNRGRVARTNRGNCAEGGASDEDSNYDHNYYPNTLRGRILEADKCILDGNTYLTPYLKFPDSKSGTQASVYNGGLTFFEFETPTGEKIRVPTGSKVECINLAIVEE